MGNDVGYGLRKPAPAEIGYIPGVCLKKHKKKSLQLRKYFYKKGGEMKNNGSKVNEIMLVSM